MSDKTDILGGSELVIDQFELVVTEGPDAGKRVCSDGETIVIGTAERCDLSLTDPAVSGFHCRVTATPKGLRVTDEGSTNGTELEGIRVESAFLARAATLAVGRTKISVSVLDSQIKQPLSPAPAFGSALGRSPAMRRIFALLARVAVSDSSILLEGETGTGKGMLARAVHDESPRRDKPFVVVDCTALPQGLFESELFGHVAGAFTGAHKASEGLFRQADGGTVFIDEIGELPLALQPKLLRVLEERAVRPVGGQAPIGLDVRVICATNRNLHREVNDGRFRIDLFYRLGGVRINIPPLRERAEDIEPLVRHFYSLFSAGKEPDPEFVDAYRNGAWPGNIRELRSSIERATLLGDLESWTYATVSTDGGEGAFDPELAFRVAKMQALASWEKRYLDTLMSHHDGNLSRAARGARMDRAYLRQLLRRHGLRD